MIDLISKEQVQEIIEQRKKVFSLNYEFYVLTPLNHAFLFWSDGDVSILDPFDKYTSSSYQPEIAKLYDVEYRSSLYFIKGPATSKHLYELFINDPECMFFQNWDELKQELQNRGLV